MAHQHHGPRAALLPRLDVAVGVRWTERRRATVISRACTSYTSGSASEALRPVPDLGGGAVAVSVLDAD